MSIPFRSGRPSQWRVVSHGTECRAGVNPLQIGASFTGGRHLCQPDPVPVSIPFRSGRPSQVGRRSMLSQTCMKCQSPSDRGVLHRPPSSLAWHGTTPLVSIPFRSGRPSQGVSRPRRTESGSLCQSPSDRGVLHSVAIGAILITFGCFRVNPLQIGASFTAGIFQIVSSLGLRVNPLQIGASFTDAFGRGRSERSRSCVNPLQIGASFTARPVRGDGGELLGVNPLQIGASFTAAEPRSHGTSRMVCQSPSDRGVLHSWNCYDVPVGKYRCQSPSDRGVLHRARHFRGVLAAARVEIPTMT